MADKILHALYDDDDKLMDAVKDLKASNFLSTKYILLFQFMD